MPIKTHTKRAVVYSGDFTPTITGKDMRELRTMRGESQAEFGVSLRRAIEPGAREGFAREYISMLESGRKPITRDIETAFYSVAQKLDGAPAVLSGKTTVRVLARPGQFPDGAIITEGARAEKCRCGAWFIRTHNFQRYCCEACPERPENKPK